MTLATPGYPRFVIKPPNVIQIASEPRSGTESRSISATMPSMVRTMRPIGPPVSMAGSRTRRLAPFSSNSCTRLRTSRVFLPKRSNLTTMRTSPGRMKSRIDASSLRPFRKPPETVSVPMALSLASWVAVPVQLWRRGRSRSGDPRGERMKGRMQRLSYPAFSSRGCWRQLGWT